jgi:hypothetical protein
MEGRWQRPPTRKTRLDCALRKIQIPLVSLDCGCHIHVRWQRGAADDRRTTVDMTTREIERAAAMGDEVAAARLARMQERRAPRTEGAVRFMAHYVTDGATKARVHYSAGEIYAPGTTWEPGKGRPTVKAVTLYAKSFDDGRALGRLFDEYENDTDSQSDYFDEGKVHLVEGHPLYAAALLRAQGNEAADKKRLAARVERAEAKRQERLAGHRAESARVAAFLRGSA